MGIQIRQAKSAEMDKVCCVLVHSPIVDFTGSLDRTEHKVDDFTVKEGCLKPLNFMSRQKLKTC